MNFRQFYETLILRDLFFYVLPGAFITGCTIVILRICLNLEIWKQFYKAVTGFGELYLFLSFLFVSYIVGFLIYIIHNKTVGRTDKLKRHLILERFLFSEEVKDNKTIQKIKSSLLNSLFPNKSIKEPLSIGDLLQIYFTADKYVRLKNLDFYSVYISRLTATSRFCGVLSVSFVIVSLLSLFILIRHHELSYIFGLIAFIGIMISFSRILYKQSIVDQEELVWNIIQSTYLIDVDDNQKFEREKELKKIENGA